MFFLDNLINQQQNYIAQNQQFLAQHANMIP